MMQDSDIFSQSQTVPRALIVESADVQAIDEMLHIVRPELEAVRVPGFLAALGELDMHSAEVVIGPVSALQGMAEATARCLRRLAPQARLLLVAPNLVDNDARTALENGFDQLLVEPVDANAFAAAIGQAAAPPSPPAVKTSQASAAAEPDASDTPPTALPAASGAAAPISDDDLGDVDLVEAVLKHRDAVLPMAMRIVTAQSGIAQVAFTRLQSHLPADHCQAPVTFDGLFFGHLHAPQPVDVESLNAWAAWLSRWLAMHAQVQQLETLSNRDELTGVWNRRYFNRFLKQLLEQAGRDRSQVTLLVFDIDDFKLYNDRYGHAAGDEILRESARLMASVVRDHDVVARIGGDEFAVIFWDAGAKRQPDSQHPDSVRKAARRFQQAICAHRFPKLGDEAPGTLTISGGLASFPWDGRTPEELLHRADAMAIQSKRQGKNAFTFGPGAMRQCGLDHQVDTAPGTDTNA